jgi:hypothetical protein
MASLAEIRAKLAAQENRGSGQSTGSGDNGIFPHWNIPEGTTTLVRFLPDGNESNTFFWVERAMIKLPFQGIKGQDTKMVQVQVPCMEMWGESCPVLTEVRPWFKDPSLEDMGRKYWKKKSYVFQGFVVDSSLKEDTTPENPIRRFIISPQIFNIIKGALMDPEMEELPTDFVRGTDFRVTKTTKGGYSDYSTSSWARRERALSDFETAAIQQHGLFNLADYLPKKPGEVELKVIKEMFEASVNNEAFDVSRWGQYFRPAGVSVQAATSGSGSDSESNSNKVISMPAVTKPAVSQAVVEDDDEPASVTTAPTSTGSSKAEEILKMIKARQQQK